MKVSPRLSLATSIIICALLITCSIPPTSATTATAEKYSTNFILSKYCSDKTQQINGYTYYKTNPDYKTILDYVFTQTPLLLDNPKSEIYLNIKDHGAFLNREVIAYSRELHPNEPQTPSNISIDEIIEKKLPSELLIEKSSKAYQPIGVFLKIDTLNKLEPKLPTKFKWISTYRYIPYRTADGTITEWLDTVYETNPTDTLTPHPNESNILYTKKFLKTHPNSSYPTIKIKGNYYINDNLNITVNKEYTNPLYRYICDNADYLIENPNSDIVFFRTANRFSTIASSYTNRDKFSTYPGDVLIAASTTRSPTKPKPQNEITVYYHKELFEREIYPGIYKNHYRVYIENPETSYKINPLFGRDGDLIMGGPYAATFLNSQHFKEKAKKINGYICYKTNPDYKTILDYVFTQTPLLLDNPKSEIYLNIKDHGAFLNREVIAYSRELNTDDHKTPADLSIDEIIQQKRKLPLELLIATSSNNNKTIGVFLYIDMLNILEPGLPTDFKWISTYKYNTYNLLSPSYWIDTIYEKQK